MGNPYFRFRQFTVWHDRCAMKVGTDGVLLGAWAGQGRPGKILDIGTGSGLIALMLAQRFPEARITGIEPDAEAAAQAGDNFLCSPWHDRLKIITSTLQDAAPAITEKFDLIVSNPPFYDNSLLNPDSRRSTARHTVSLPCRDLMNYSAGLLNENGRIDIIIPPECWRHVLNASSRAGLHPLRLTRVHSTTTSGAKRFLASFGREDGILNAEEVLLTAADGTRSEWYRELTEGFYLN